MKMTSRFLLFFAAAAGLAAAQTADDFAPVTQLITDSLARVGPNCSFIITRNDSVLYKHYFGIWNDSTYRPVASGSKMPSMAVIMTLVETGVMHLDDTVQNYLPSFGGKPVITLAELMSHTSGLPDSSPYLSDNAMTLAEAVDSIGLYTPMSPYAPGTAFIYSGVDMHVAGRMAEIAGGMGWDSLFNLKIAAPLKLQHTDYLGLGATTNFRIAGGMGTTLPDYAKFLNFMCHFGADSGVRILDSVSVKTMEIDQTHGVPLVYTPYVDDPMHADIRYGFGTWLERVNPHNNMPVELGDQGAFGFTPWIDRCRNISAVFFVLRTAPEIQPTEEALRALVERIIPITLPVPAVRWGGGALHSSAAAGNQWLRDGQIIPGAVDSVYQPDANGTYAVRVTDNCGCDTTSADFTYSAVPVRPGAGGTRSHAAAETFDVAGRSLGSGAKAFIPVQRRRSP